jgi:alkylated DNA repair dioxygenase AlkB
MATLRIFSVDGLFKVVLLTPGLCGRTPVSDSTDLAGNVEKADLGAVLPTYCKDSPPIGSLAFVSVSTTEGQATWIVPEPVVERVQLDESSWVDVVRRLLPEDTAAAVHDELVATVPWEQGRVFRYERWVDMPRLEGYQSGSSRHPALVEAEHWISRRYRVRFDGVALAHYRNERDGVGFHRDRELRWLEDTVIGALTLGARRPWLMKPLTGIRHGDEDDLVGAIDLSPGSGDLLVMGGRCQAAWLHAVPKVRHRVRSRVSGQWRWTSRRGERDRNPSFFAPRHYSR